jgi:hypothetical protein
MAEACPRDIRQTNIRLCGKFWQFMYWRSHCRSTTIRTRPCRNFRHKNVRRGKWK